MPQGREANILRKPMAYLTEGCGIAVCPTRSRGSAPHLVVSVSQYYAWNGCHSVPCFGAEKLFKVESRFSITTTNGYR